MRFLAYGGGVQSTALALAAEDGLVPAYDAIIFADTGSEKQATYDLVEQVTGMITPEVVIARHHSGQSLEDHVLNRIELNRRSDNPPFWSIGGNGKEAPLMQKCTREFKGNVVEKAMRKLANGTKAVVQSRGISLDEINRMKPSPKPWYSTDFPLITDLRWTRQHCEQFITEVAPQLTLSKSACWFCPWSSSTRWRELRDTHKTEWDKATKFDESIRGGLHGSPGPLYLHRSLLPLAEAVERSEDQMDLFDNECEGLCGV